MTLPKFLQDGLVVGPQEYPPGSVERAKLLSIQILSKFSSLTTTTELWKVLVQEAEKEQVHAIYKFPTFDDYLRELIGVDRQAAAAEMEKRRLDAIRAALETPVANKIGDNQHTTTGSDKKENYPSQTPGQKGGTSSSARVARLKRDHPEVAKKLERGEFKSVAAAVRYARGEEPDPPRKKLPPLERIQRLYDNLSPADREAFLLWVNQRGA